MVKGYAVSVTGMHVKQLKTNHFLLVCPSYSSITDMCFTEIERKLTPFPRRLSKETLLLHLMNSAILPTSFRFLKETNFSPESLLLMYE